MGIYVYKVTAKRVKLVNGEEANVAVFAYKDHFWDDKLVARMRKSSSCHIAERFVEGKNFTGRVVIGYKKDDGSYELSTVSKLVKVGTFDDNWYGTLPAYENVVMN